ncbi:FAD-dependent oxidoreductase [Pseudomonas sp. BN417]|uniref:FAD-dependent oxidoreductase n=1 Tax=Pseudomonas sp. BN417 TaxID=2567890 RepID=UPI002457301B|nr:FAD-dependent oxidoreductase [Pseudomonas sp. BN417]
MIEISEPVTAVAAPLAVATQPLVAAVAAQPVVIIGSGHAGYGLAQELRKANPQLDIRVLTQECGHGYSKPALSIALAQGRSAAALATESPLALERRLDIRVYTHCRVERIDTEAQRLYTSLGEMEYGQLVLASGASPVRLPIEGRADALLSVNNLQDYREFRERLEGVRRVAILGDGLIGCEFANDLANSGYQVRVIGLGAWPMARLLPEAAGLHLRQALSGLGVQWNLRTTLQRVDQGTDGYRLTLSDGQVVEADLVLSAVGLRPNLQLAVDAGLACGRGIQVDACLQTSKPGIFALGDCIEVDGQLLPYLAPINEGIRALARTLAGQSTAVSYPLMPVTVKTPAAPLCLLPPPVDCEGEWSCEATSDGLRAAFHDSAGAMRGFVLLGRQAQLKRNAWLQNCQDIQQNVA